MTNNNLRYFIYARKSLESEDRQIQSIDDQIDYLTELAKRENLNIIDTLVESKSAKKPNERPVFSQMIERIKKGEADAIMCWQINRLSRNPVDSGTIQWLLQGGIIKEIKTSSRTFLSEDNVLLFAVESGSANQFILDLQKNTKRGLDGKIKRGWLPGKAPHGYLNSPRDSENIIIEDPERFLLIRKMWDLLLTGQYSVEKILNIANNEWGFRSRQTKKMGGVPIIKSVMYRIFHNPFYYGVIQYRGKLHNGNHKPMVTFDEFQLAQKILSKVQKPQPQTREFSYTGLIKCGHCGCSITGEEKHKFNKTKNEWCNYVYYRCTKKKPDVKCSGGRLTLKEIEDQISDILKQYEIDDQFRDWALSVLERNCQVAAETRNKRQDMLNDTYAKTQKQLNNLTQMRIKDMIDDDQFNEDRIRLSNELTNIGKQLNDNEELIQRQAIDRMDRSLALVSLARQVFDRTKDIKVKREILSSLGISFVIKDQQLSVDYVHWLISVQTFIKRLRNKILRFELAKFILNKQKNEANCLALPLGGGYRELNSS